MVDYQDAGVMMSPKSSTQELYLGLDDQEWDLIKGVFARHPNVTSVIVFGSRAKGIFDEAADIDLAVEGIDDPLEAERIASELDELPLPYRFDVQALSTIRHRSLKEHIDRVGVRVYRSKSKKMKKY